MGRNIAAVVAGVIVAVGLVMLLESAGYYFYPMPADLNMDSMEALRSHIANLPVGAFLLVGMGWFLGTLGGTLTACKIGIAKPVTFALIIGGLMLATTTFNLITIPHPLWFSISGIAAVVVAAWIGLKICERRGVRLKPPHSRHDSMPEE